MSRDSRPPPDGTPPASGPQERRDEFLRARGLDPEGVEAPNEADGRGDDVEDACPDEDAVRETDVVDTEEESPDS